MADSNPHSHDQKRPYSEHSGRAVAGPTDRQRHRSRVFNKKGQSKLNIVDFKPVDYPIPERLMFSMCECVGCEPRPKIVVVSVSVIFVLVVTLLRVRFAARYDATAVTTTLN